MASKLFEFVLTHSTSTKPSYSARTNVVDRIKKGSLAKSIWPIEHDNISVNIKLLFLPICSKCFNTNVFYSCSFGGIVLNYFISFNPSRKLRQIITFVENGINYMARGIFKGYHNLVSTFRTKM